MPDGGRITAIDICALNDNLTTLLYFAANFAAGGQQIIRDLPQVIPKNKCTGWRDLDGDLRNVVSVELFARSDRDQRPTEVIVWGQTEQTFPQVGPDEHRIGATRLQDDGTFRHPEIGALGANVSQVRMCAAAGDLMNIDLFGVVADNGFHQYQTRDVIKNGTCTQLKNLQGRTNIQTILLQASSNIDRRNHETKAVFWATPKRAEPPPPPPPPPTEFPQMTGAHLLGVIPNITDKRDQMAHTVSLPNPHRFSELALCAKFDGLIIKPLSGIVANYVDSDGSRPFKPVIVNHLNIAEGECTDWGKLSNMPLGQVTITASSNNKHSRTTDIYVYAR
jgi:hypothetical protein